MLDQPLHVLIRQQESVYVAQCVEYDIAAEGQTLEDAKRAFAHTIIRHVLAARQLNRPLFECAGKPPAEVVAAWRQTVDRGVPLERLDIPSFTIHRRDDTAPTMPDFPRFAELAVCA